MIKTARDIHGQVEHLRESGEFLKALQLSEEVFSEYQKNNDAFGMGDILASRSITLRLLWEDTQDSVFLVRAKHECFAAVEITSQSEEKSDQFMPLFRLAQVQEELGENLDACQSYKLAIEIFQNNPPKEHNRPAVLNDMKVRYSVCGYKTGNTEALSDALGALHALELDEQEPAYNKHVWISGGHMKIAEVLKEHDLQEARNHLQKAKDIIDADPDLAIRKKQWQKLSDSFE